MSLPPKSRFRLMILIGVCMALVLGVLVLKASRNARDAARLAAMRQAAMEVYARGEYAAAMPKLSEYLAAKEQSPEQLDALYAFADCRRRFAIPGKPNEHLSEALQRLDDYLQTRANEERVLRLQLKIQTDPLLAQRQGNQSEILNRAKKLLDIRPDDVEALSARATVLVRRAKPVVADAQKAVDKLLSVAPNNVRGLVLAAELKFRSGAPPADWLKQVDAGLAAHPNDPVYESVAARAYIWAAMLDPATRDGNWMQGKNLVVAAASRPVKDVELVEFIAGLLDEVEQFKDSTAYLRVAADKLANADLARIVVRRLWQADQFAEAIERTAKADPSSTLTSADLLAYRALSLQARAWSPDAGDDRTRLQNEADTLASALGKRTLEPDAVAWSIVLKADADRRPLAAAATPSTLPALPATNPAERTGGPTAGELVKAYRRALEKDMQNAVAMARLGDSLQAISETEPAMQQWVDAARQRPDWAYPLARRATVFLEAGVTDQALWFAERARRRSPDSRVIDVLWAQAAFAATTTGAAGQGAAETLLKEVESIQKNYPFDPGTLPIQISLLARVRGAEAAGKRLDEVLAADPPPPADVLLGLHVVDRTEKLGFTDRIDTELGKVEGGPARLAVRKAQELLMAGKPTEGLKVMLDAQKQAGGEHDKAWMLMVADYRDRAGDPQGPAAVAAVADQFSQDLFVQGQVLRTNAIQRDRALWDRTIDRIKNLTGEGGARWKQERAVYYLAGPASADDVKKAITLLTPLVEQNRASFDLRRLLSRAYLMDGQHARAAEQLQDAQRLRPGNVAVTLELAEALRLAHKPVDAATQLGALPVSRLSAEQRVAVAHQYEQLGQPARAIELLERLPASGGRDGDLGRLYRGAGRMSDAENAYRRLLGAENAQPMDLFAGADFFASRGDRETADQLLVRLKNTKTSPAVVEMLLGQFEEAYGSSDAARAHLIKATELDPKNAFGWRARAAFLIRANNAEEAERICDDGLKLIGMASPELTALKSLAKTVRSLKHPELVALLVRLLTNDPTNTAATATLAALAEAQSAEAALPASDADARKQLSEKTREKLTKLAGEHPDFWLLQDELIQHYLRIGRVEEAAAIAERAMTNFPASQEPARLAVEAHLSLGRWNDVERVAVLWRQRSGADTVAADVALAEVLLARKQPTLAIGRLEPDIRAHPLPAPGGATAPSTNPSTRPAAGELRSLASLYRAYGRALIEAGRVADAEKALSPLLSLAGEGRTTWLAIAPAHSKVDAARRWIEQAVAARADSEKPDPAEQVAVAQAWLEAGRNVGDVEFLKRGAALLEPLTTAAATTTIAASGSFGTIDAFRIHGLTAHYLGDYDKAEWCWRTLRKLAGGSADPEAMNNLAYVLLIRGAEKDRAEAMTLAKQAVAASPTEPSYVGTLARAQAAAGDHKSAIDGYRKVLMKDATSIEAKLGLADELSSQGTKPNERAEAKRLLGEVTTALKGGPLQPPEIPRQLELLKARIETADSR